MLAQGGFLRIMEDHLLFVPRNIEKAMGASDVEIPFGEVKMVEVTGAITESLMVRTQEKAHRFVGSDLQKISENINSALSRFNPRAAALSARSGGAATPKDETQRKTQNSLEKAGVTGSCPSCFKPLKPEYNFCPACGSSVKKICPKCQHGLDAHWKHCAFCGAAA